MGEIAPLLEFMKTPLGITGLAIAAVLLISRSNNSLAKVLAKVVPELVSSISELRVRMDTSFKIIKANTDAQAETRKDIRTLRQEITDMGIRMDQFQAALRHSDERHASLITHVVALTAAIEKFLSRARTEVNKLNEVAVGGGSHTKLKKTGNDPGENQGG